MKVYDTGLVLHAVTSHASRLLSLTSLAPSFKNVWILDPSGWNNSPCICPRTLQQEVVDYSKFN